MNTEVSHLFFEEAFIYKNAHWAFVSSSTVGTAITGFTLKLDSLNAFWVDLATWCTGLKCRSPMGGLF